MIEWSGTLGDVPIYLHRDDMQWVMRPDKYICLWDGETRDLPGGLKLIRGGGRFEGACVLHWPEGSSGHACGNGALLTGDTIQVVPDRKSVSFMYNYPNYIPLNAKKVKRIVATVQPFAFGGMPWA